MALSICENYSGVVINQNHPPAEDTDFLTIGKAWYYQSFRLPKNYRYGSKPEQYRYPDLSGFQLLVGIDEGFAASVQLNYTIDYYIFGSGWSNLAKGKVVGAHADGPQIWMDIYFEKPIPVSQTITESLIRIGFQNESPPSQSIEKVWFAQPNPISSGLALESDSLTPLTATEGDHYSFCFRILSLTADNGTDFLGNPYRSFVTTASAENISTTKGENSGYWLSSPQPSQFSVVSNYFDVRPVPETAYGLVNFIYNPSFEYDDLGSAPYGWSTITTGIGDGTASVVVSNFWASQGIQSARVSGKTSSTGGGVSGIQSTLHEVNPETPYTFAADVNIIELPPGLQFRIQCQWFNSEEILLGQNETTISSLGVKSIAVINSISPPNSTKVRLLLIARNHTDSVAEPFEFYVDAIQLTETATLPEYFDGDSIDCQWDGQFGRSGSIQILDNGPEENTVVIDSVLLDPLTPNFAFNVYYSIDGTANDETTEKEWENKLWVRVPKTFVANQRQTFVFPEPIIAKFVQIEYSYLQAQSYNPGQNQIPVTYKKFPTWVADFFIAQMEEPQFIANKVGVSYDALDFAYNYYLDDLKEEPAKPVAAPSSVISTLTEYFNSNLIEADTVDATTLAKINLVMNTYTQPPAAQANFATLLGKASGTLALSNANYPVEKTIELGGVNLSDVSSLNRSSVVFEQNMPVMFFYLTCRHAYKELTATFDYNRAYFAGVKEVAFIRNEYTTTYDGQLYIETGGDDTNTEINDWLVDSENIWTVY